jgi:hypothetical protein
MAFSLLHPDKVRIFPTREEAEAFIPSDDRISYLAIYTVRGATKGWILAKYTSRHDLGGYLEVE